MMRPHEPLLEFLRDNGCKVSWVKNGPAPCLKVCGGALPSGEWKGPGELSSQFLSGLALAAHARGGVSLLLPDKIASSGYFQMTEDILKSFPSQAVDEGAEFEVPADASAATFFLVLLAIRRSRLFFTRAWSQEHPEAQVARWLLDSQILQKKGKEFSATSEYPNTELEVNLDPFPDAGPALAVLASHLPHGLSFTGLQRLRIKESDRIDGMVRLANAVGAQALLEGDNLLRISPHSAGPKPGGVFDSSGDHRLAMAGAIAGLEVSQPDCVAKSFPGFWSELRRFTES
jgi:3-phosphoshikimate 1-carboxyvinyltransferase